MTRSKTFPVIGPKLAQPTRALFGPQLFGVSRRPPCFFVLERVHGASREKVVRRSTSTGNTRIPAFFASGVAQIESSKAPTANLALWRATEVEGGACRGISRWERSVAGVCSPAERSVEGVVCQWRKSVLCETLMVKNVPRHVP